MKSIIKHQETIRLADGRLVTLWVEKLLHGEYRTMLFEDIRKPIAKSSFTNEVDALAFFEYLRNRHLVPKLIKDFEQFAKDLKTAVNYAREYIGNDLDNDDCNRNQDTLYLILSGWDKSQIMSAARTAELYCYKARHTQLDIYFFLPFDIEQGSSRTKVAETMCMYLEVLGYRARVSYTLF